MGEVVTGSKFKWQDACGLVGVGLAVAAMNDMPIAIRLIFFGACAVCLPFSFFSHKNWPLWVRWVGSVIVVPFMFYMGWSAWASSRPKALRQVSLEWRQPAPMESGSALSDLQLNAKATRDGHEIAGRYIYNPTFGAVLSPGMDTLSVEFTPEDLSRFAPQKQTVVILVKERQPESVPRSSLSPHQRIKPTPSSSSSATIDGDINQNAGPCGINNIGGTVSGNTCVTPPTPPSLIEQATAMRQQLCVFANQWRDAVNGEKERAKKHNADLPNRDMDQRRMAWDVHGVNEAQITYYEQTYRDKAISLRGDLLTELHESPQPGSDYTLRARSEGDDPTSDEQLYVYSSARIICDDFARLVGEYQQKLATPPQ